MDIELITKVDELLTIFDNSEEFKKLLFLKEQIYKDQDLAKLIKKFQKIKDNPRDINYVKYKSEILENSNVKEYKKIENDLFLLTIKINKKMQELTSKKRCHHAHN